MKLLSIISFICFVFPYKCDYIPVAFPDVYWREYNGTIPQDAVPGGKVNGAVTYIGQGYVKDRGIASGVIHSGQKTISVPLYGVKVVDNFIQILCSPQPETLKWVPITANTLHLVSIYKHLIRGGEETSHVTYLGRVNRQKQIMVGKVVSGPHETPGVAPMYYVDGKKEVKVDSYEILTFDPLS